MRTPITYYGGKQQMLPEILSKIPAHRIYVEPYLGGGAVFFAKNPSYLEVLNDINDSVMNFYEVLKTDFNALWKLVDASLLSESLHQRANRILRHPEKYSNVQHAWAFWMNTNFNHTSKLGGGMHFDNGESGGHSGIRMKYRKEQFLEAYSNRLAHVQLHHRDALTVIRQRNKADTFTYADPPYPGSNQGHYKGFTVSDLLDLAELLSKSEGKFMLSNYAIPELVEFATAAGWTIEYHAKRLSAPKAKNQRKVEVLYYNYTIEPTLF